jgi:hypothetical protein
MLTRSGKKIASDQWKLENRKRYIPLSTASSESSLPSIEFDKLPLDIFHIIQSYLPHFDYRQLLNCNKLVFSPIKYETCYFNFIPLNKWTSEMSAWDYQEQVPEFCAEFIQFNVKDKSKQVEMSIEYTTKANFLLFQDLINGIHHLSVDFQNASSSRIPRLVFQNISQLQLCYTYGLTTLDSLEFMNLHSLSILKAPFLADITALGKVKTLKKVVLNCCKSLVDISSVKDLPSVTIFSCKKIVDISMFGSQDEVFKFRSPSRTPLITPFLNQFVKTKTLSVVGVLKPEFCVNLSENRTINDLTLLHQGLDSLMLPCCFTNFIHLTLKNFDLSRWKTALPKLRTTELDNCSVLDYTPFIFVRELFFKNSSVHENHIDFTKFLKLKSLSFLDCHTLQQVSYPFTLIHLGVIGCPEVAKISGMVRYLTIAHCDNLHFTDCSGMQAGSVQLHDLPKLTNFSCVKDVPEVEVVLCDNFVDCSVLKNAEYLFIKNCSAVTDVSVLGNAKRLRIRSCSGVVSLKGLKNVEELSVSFCPLESLEGLENNKVVLIEGISRSVYEEYEYGPYGYLSEKIPRIKVIPGSSITFRSFFHDFFG